MHGLSYPDTHRIPEPSCRPPPSDPPPLHGTFRDQPFITMWYFWLCYLFKIQWNLWKLYPFNHPAVV